MRVKTFQGRTMADALEQVKRHFGRGAVILNTRTLTKGGFLGLGAKPYVEITAAHGMSDLPNPLRRSTLLRSGRNDPVKGSSQPATRYALTESAREGGSVLKEIGALKSLVKDLVRQTQNAGVAHVPEQLYNVYLKLVENEVAAKLARQIIDEVRGALTTAQLGDPRAVRNRIARALEAMLPIAGPIRVAPVGESTVIALVGPTGVGKTTTIAKLAANFSLRQHLKVGLITIDTYRIAAVEQLKTYAQIINVPLEVVICPEELKEAVRRMADRDVVLIDTAGRSQRDTIKIRELGRFFESVKPHEVHLVLSSTGGEAVLSDTIERFSPLGVDRVIFTKLDEAIGFGVILNCLQKADAQLSYVTAGQDVPDDIEVGKSTTLARLIMGEPAANLGTHAADGY